MDDVFEAVFFGTSGSCAANNGARARHGTNTPSVAIRVGGNTLLLDAGTGICGLRQFVEYQNERLHMFLSHYHTDHIEGLLFWNELFNEKQKISIYGQGMDEGDVSGTLTQYLKPPFSPVSMEVFRAGLDFYGIKAGDEIKLADGVSVRAISLSHPGGCLGYKVSYDGKSICYLTDVELYNHENDNELYEYVQNTDLLILDSFFKDGERIKGWGHSGPIECAKLAKRANAKKLALYHYSFSFTDEEIDVLEKLAKEVFANSFASADGLRIII